MAISACLAEETSLQPKGSVIFYEDRMNKMGDSCSKVERRICLKDPGVYLTLLLSTYVIVTRFLKSSGPLFCHV